MDFNQDFSVKQKNVVIFSQRQMMQLVKHIYQVVIYQQQIHVLQLEQIHVKIIQLQAQMIASKQLFANHYWIPLERFVDLKQEVIVKQKHVMTL